MNSNKSLDNWDTLYANGIRGKYPNEMLIRFINSKFPYDKRTNCKILDLGYGTGRHLIYLAEEGFKTFGIEYSSNGEKLAKEWLRKKGLTADLKVGSAIDTCFENINFDAVVDIASIQHNSREDMKKIVLNVYNILKQGGYFFSVLKNTYDSNYKEGLRIKNKTYEFSDAKNKIDTPTILTFNSYSDIKSLFGKFSEIEIEKEEWTYNNQNKRVSHWIVTAQK
jgi:SAM-dependent methyltransferase